MLFGNNTIHIPAPVTTPPYISVIPDTYSPSIINFVPCVKQYTVSSKVDFAADINVVTMSQFSSTISHILFSAIDNSLMVAK